MTVADTKNLPGGARLGSVRYQLVRDGDVPDNGDICSRSAAGTRKRV